MTVRPHPSDDPTRADQLDEALDALAGRGAEFAGGLSNHGPMAAESLVRLGRGADALAWVVGYRRHLEPAEGDAAIAEATGRFRRELAERAWQDVLRDHLPGLLPGVMAAATHGVIRTAQAARALAERDNRLRRDELAAGLGYWHARYQELPGRPAPRGGLAVADALAAVPAVPDDRRRGRLITDEVAEVDTDAFPAAVDDAAAPTGGVDAAFDELVATAAGAYLAHASTAPIAFVHAVTGPAAVRLLLPYLDDAAAALAFAYSWQAVAALQAAYGRRPPVRAGDVEDPGEPDWDDLADRAVASGDEHVIKLVEACRREHARNAGPEAHLLARAAERVAGRPIA